MQTEPIQVLIEAIDGNTAALAEIQTKLGGIKTTTGEMATQQASLGQQFKASWTEINSAIGVAKQAYQLLKGAVDATVGTFVAYADQVRTISQVTGQSSVEVSRMIQVTDDYKIKTESLNMVMKKMATEGMPLSIDALARLSDEYLKLAPGVERQIFLTENFGRGGADFAEIMLAGGDAIRTQSEAISDNLILTEEAVQKARDYEIAQDDLKDSVEGLKIAIGQELTPVITAGAQSMTAAMTANQLYNQAMALGIDVGRNMGTGMVAVNGILVDQTELLRLVTEAESANTAEITISGPLYAQWLQNLQNVNTDLEVQTALLLDETGWETMYTAAQNATEQTKISFDWLGQQLTTQMGAMSLQGGELWQALLIATGEISPTAVAAFLQVQRDFATLKALLAMGLSIDVIVNWYTGQTGGTTPPYIPPVVPPIVGGGGGGGGDWIRVGPNTTPGMIGGWWMNTVTGNYEERALGGGFNGWVMVGDAPGGRITPYTEWVYGSGTVYNQAQMAGKSAPPMAAGGQIPPMPTESSEIYLSQPSIRDLDEALYYKLAAVL